MAQTCSRVAAMRQSLLNDYKGELPLEAPKKTIKTGSYENVWFFYLYSTRELYMRSRDISIYELSDKNRDKLSLLNLKRIEDLSKNLDEYDGSFIEI